MTTRWGRWRAARRLSGLSEPGEAVALVERLGLGGYWVTTDRALYILASSADRQRLPFGDISGVTAVPGRTTTQVTITTRSGGVVVGDLPRGSSVADRLSHLDPPADEPSQP